MTLRNFNISVGVTDAFMEAVRDDRLFDLRHPARRPAGSLPAKAVFDAITEAAWLTGDPGLLFLDSIHRTQPTPHLGRIEATNPCGEIPLLPFESCNLGSINLAHMVRQAGGKTEIDWERLRHTAAAATRFLDDVIEVSRYPVAEIERMTRGNRKIGLGVMGFAEMLLRLDLSYDSDEAVRIGGQIMEVIAGQANRTSRQLAAERGVFPNWKGSLHEARGMRLRNATLTAIAPTGTIGIIAGKTPSIEPLFAIAYRHTHVLEGQVLPEPNPIFRETLIRRGIPTEPLIAAVASKGHMRDVKGVPEDLKRLFVTALEIPPSRHIQIQAAFQRYVDNSVSKTVNLPWEATVQDVAEAYWHAWKLGLKGITIYRYGSKSSQVLELGLGEEAHHYDHASKCDPEECKV